MFKWKWRSDLEKQDESTALAAQFELFLTICFFCFSESNCPDHRVYLQLQSLDQIKHFFRIRCKRMYGPSAFEQVTTTTCFFPCASGYASDPYDVMDTVWVRIETTVEFEWDEKVVSQAQNGLGGLVSIISLATEFGFDGPFVIGLFVLKTLRNWYREISRHRWDLPLALHLLDLRISRPE